MSTDLNTQPPSYLTSQYSDVNGQPFKLNLKPASPETQKKMVKIDTGPGCLVHNSTNAGLNLAHPEPTSGVCELFGACKNLCSEVTERITPNVHARLFPQPEGPALNIHNPDLTLNKRSAELRLG